MVAIALRTIGEATRFFLTRHWVRTRIGPYVVSTTEVRPSAYETRVTWGEEGPEVERFGSGLALDRERAEEIHEELCGALESETGTRGVSTTPVPAA